MPSKYKVLKKSQSGRFRKDSWGEQMQQGLQEPRQTVKTSIAESKSLLAPKNLDQRDRADRRVRTSLSMELGTFGMMDPPLCIECGKIGHMSKACTGPPLEAWEKTILKGKFFGPPGAFVKPQRGKMPSQQEVSHVETVVDSEAPEVKSLAAGVAGLEVDDGYLPLEINLGEGSRPNKRAGGNIRGAAQKRREIIEEDSHTAPPENVIPPPAKTKPGRKKTGLALLRGFSEAEDPSYKPLSVREIFDSFKAEINLTDLLQYSPFLVASLKKFMTRETARRKKRTGTQPLSEEACEDKTFRFPAQIKIVDQIFDLPRSVTQADQGSELNLVSEGFLRTYWIPKKPLSDIGYQGMSMKTATKVESFHFWAEIEIAVQGIWREVPFFVSTSPRRTSISSNDVLLGIPWLFDVNARLDIRRGVMVIGDTDRGETRVIVQGPELTSKSKKEKNFERSLEERAYIESSEEDDEYVEENYEDSSDEDRESN
ncbi:hypothetical protein ACJ73_07455 [Blastomyces percursus]|uniref:CCHC-type domain-containing protein n=1 Tax=Blastomyces percursus TaxID=1658174 RepID=A0A1J9QYD4_9EURO|nr:hypothetical protein ACJ73_07455 [Blastomyces percursus]